MNLSLGDIAGRFGCELRGDPDVEVSHVATLANANGGSVSFLANAAYRDQLAETRAAAVILGPDDVDACPAAALIAKNPYAVYAHVASELHPPPSLVAGVHSTASVARGATVPESCEVAPGAVVESGALLGERVYVGPNTFVGRGSRLGDDTRLMCNVSVYHGVRIGARCIIHSGAVIGADGFGIAQDSTGWTKVPQIGGVDIGDDVEIGANTTVDRGAIDDTVIGNGAKLDNQIQIAHNVTIGEHTAMAALTGVSGSSSIGARCLIGGASIVAGHLSICDDVMLAAGTGVASAISEPGAYGGFPANVEDISRWRKNVIRYGQLDDMARRLRKLEKQLAKLADDA
ncbi:MAG: UDP-3-O-(3-hydroxymyristoyl)glucosamine N-acyltransferase [Gammaproteobacteria bacterium]|nr:UDP-3-O-(3-hydroxymyristoyl)glucosamine N-acyltransferase [Gammaproteobacteria bacterium]MBT8444834.1 UDP-3-O-(3-hydroxymyristoyl)glucosamine N-acyltransferase [Gammaproteobacteria bacterium]NND35610.1 UDP-3-O-(3-hydroxymyristoyl)glucosamine N-acyltransferase [Gammaproteobacteria bacterium]